MKFILVVTLGCLSACTWFGSRRHQPPEPSEILVTGAPRGSVAFVDGKQAAPEVSVDDHPQVLGVSAGPHTIEIRLSDTVVYREETYVATGEHRVVAVLSGLNR